MIYDLSFNICFIGTYSFTKKKGENNMQERDRFNPCFIGTYSFTLPSALPAIVELAF